MNTIEQEMVVSVTVGAAAVFSLVDGITNERVGKKFTILISSVLFVGGSVILGAAYNFNIGQIDTRDRYWPIFNYNANVWSRNVAPHVRGEMITMFQLMITFGQFMASVIGAAFSYIEDKNVNWRLMLIFTFHTPAALQFFGFLFMPESARWLVSVGKMDLAYNVLKSVYVYD